MPMSKPALKPTTIPKRRALVRRIVEDELAQRVLYEPSDEKWTLDPRGSWKIHEQVAGTDPGAGLAEASYLDRPTGALPVMSHFIFPDALCVVQRLLNNAMASSAVRARWKSC